MIDPMTQIVGTVVLVAIFVAIMAMLSNHFRYKGREEAKDDIQ